MVCELGALTKNLDGTIAVFGYGFAGHLFDGISVFHAPTNARTKLLSQPAKRQRSLAPRAYGRI